jgi:hypothetical protein
VSQCTFHIAPKDRPSFFQSKQTEATIQIIDEICFLKISLKLVKKILITTSASLYNHQATSQFALEKVLYRQRNNIEMHC